MRTFFTVVVLVVGSLFGAACVAAASGDPSVQLVTVTPTRISARGGTQFTLKGTGFSEATVVQVGGVAAKAKFISAEELRVTSPPLLAGRASLLARTGQGNPMELKDVFEVLPLSLRFVEAPPESIPLASTVPLTSAVAGDFDGDGAPDLLTCAGSGRCQLLKNDGVGNFSGPSAASDGGDPDAGPAPAFPDHGAQLLLAADVDGDGDQDVFLGLPGAVAFLQNDGAAHFAEIPEPFGADGGVTTATAPLTAAVLADVDGDGRLDLVSASSAADAVPFHVDRNVGAAGQLLFASVPDDAATPRGWHVSALVVADVDRDGDPDLILATPGAADGVGLRLFRNEQGVFHELPNGLPPGAGTTIAALAAGDVNGDGAVDLVAVGAGQDRLLLNDGTGHFFDATTGALPVDGSKGVTVSLVDLDKDRDLDLVIGNAGAETRLYLNDGAGHFSDDTPVLPLHADGTVWVGPVNVDGDGDDDLFVVNADAASLRLYLSVEPRQ